MERMGAMKGQVQSAAVQMKLSNTQQNMVDSLADASKAMGNMNATMDPAKMAKTMNEFQIQNEKMDLKQVSHWHTDPRRAWTDTSHFLQV